MPKVPEFNKPTPPKRNVMIVCTRGGKPLTAEDQKALDEYLAYRIARAKKRRKDVKE